MSWTDFLPAIGGLLGAFGGDDEPAGQTTTTTAPWGPQQGYLLDVFNQAQGASDYGSQPTPDQIAAQTEMGKWASGENYNPLLGQSNPGLSQNADQQYGMDQYKQWATGGYQNPLLGQNNPYLQSVIDAQSQDAMRNIMPMMNKANAASGSFGNSGVAETYGRMASDTLGNIANRTRFQDYQNQQQLQENQLNRQFGALNPFMANASNQQQNQIADFNQQRGLFENDANRRITATGQFQNQANYEQQLPWNNVKNYGGAISGNYGNSQSSPYFTSTASNVLGGIGAGSWIAKQFGNT